MGVRKIFTEAEMRKQIYGALSSYLARECCIDSKDNQYHDRLWAVQIEMIKEFKQMAAGAPPVPD